MYTLYVTESRKTQSPKKGHILSCTQFMRSMDVSGSYNGRAALITADEKRVFEVDVQDILIEGFGPSRFINSCEPPDTPFFLTSELDLEWTFSNEITVELKPEFQETIKTRDVSRNFVYGDGWIGVLEYRRHRRKMIQMVESWTLSALAKQKMPDFLRKPYTVYTPYGDKEFALIRKHP